MEVVRLVLCMWKGIYYIFQSVRTSGRALTRFRMWGPYVVCVRTSWRNYLSRDIRDSPNSSTWVGEFASFVASLKAAYFLSFFGAR